MKLLRLLCLALGLVLLPGLARAAPAPIALADYQARLQRAAAEIESARATATAGGSGAAISEHLSRAGEQLGSTWVVDTGRGTVETDLRPVTALLDKATKAGADQRALIGAAGDAVQEHLKAAQSLNQAQTINLPDARKRLDEALKANEVKQSLTQRFVDWLRKLFGGEQQEQSTPKAATPSDGAPWLKWGALIIGALGIAALMFSLMRSLQAQAGGDDTAVRSGKRLARTDRPLTPEEMLEEASQYAAAGDYKEALRTAHLAVLQHYDRLALLRYDPALTNREHERLLRRKFPTLARGLHALNDLVETGLYSGHGASAADFARGEQAARELWREGEDASKSAQAPTGASSAASSR